MGKYFRAGQTTDCNTAHAQTCWITKAANTHSYYVTLTDFPLQQQLHERISVLHHMYIACLVECYSLTYSIKPTIKFQTAIVSVLYISDPIIFIPEYNAEFTGRSVQTFRMHYFFHCQGK